MCTKNKESPPVQGFGRLYIYPSKSSNCLLAALNLAYTQYRASIANIRIYTLWSMLTTSTNLVKRAIVECIRGIARIMFGKVGSYRDILIAGSREIIRETTVFMQVSLSRGKQLRIAAHSPAAAHRKLQSREIQMQKIHSGLGISHGVVVAQPNEEKE